MATERQTQFCKRTPLEVDFMLQEQLVPLRNVPDQLPKRNGKSLNPATVYRWCTVGLSGHRLETVRVGGCLFTSSEAIKRFIERTNSPVGS